MLEVQHIFKTFRNNETEIKVLQDICFEVRESEFFSILGPSGCGKTTLLKIIAGLEIQDSGEITFKKKMGEIKTPIVWQEHRLYPWLTVLKNVEFGLQLVNGELEQDEVSETAQKYLHMIGLTGFENYYPSQISGGMAQRVAIARALAVDPDMLLLDEPFASVDYQTKLILSEEIKEIQKKTQKTIIHVTHNIRDAISFSDRLVVLSARPAKVKDVIVVTSNESPVSTLEKRVWELLKPEAMKVDSVRN